MQSIRKLAIYLLETRGCIAPPYNKHIIICLCGLVVRVSGYRYRGLGFDSLRYQIFLVAVGLERGALSLVGLVRSIKELLE